MSLKTVINHLENAILFDDKLAEAYFQLAIIHYEASEFNEAIHKAQKAIKKSNHLINFSKNRSSDLLSKNNFNESKREQMKIALISKKCSYYYTFLCEIFLLTKNYVQCKKNACEAIKIYQNNSDAYLFLSYISSESENWEDAAKNATKSIEIEFQNAKSHLQLAQIKFSQNKKQETVHHYLIAKDLDEKINDDKLEKISKKYPNA